MENNWKMTTFIEVIIFHGYAEKILLLSHFDFWIRECVSCLHTHEQFQFSFCRDYFSSVHIGKLSKRTVNQHQFSLLYGIEIFLILLIWAVKIRVKFNEKTLNICFAPVTFRTNFHHTFYENKRAMYTFLFLFSFIIIHGL